MLCSKRTALIDALLSRGFKPGKSKMLGWCYIHKEDGMTVDFYASGQFRFTQSNGKEAVTANGVMSEPEHLLALIDKASEAL
jgi:hypothetical protein